MAIITIPSESQASLLSRCASWYRTLDRAAAIDSARNVFAVLGVGAVFAYMGTMPPLLVPVGLAITAGAWYADYLRHF
jgi:hypothetical protein